MISAGWAVPNISDTCNFSATHGTTYSGGFVSAAYSLHVGGLGSRVIGVVLLDALYGELDKFSSWILNNRARAGRVAAGLFRDDAHPRC
jgi:hypothetical protein